MTPLEQHRIAVRERLAASGAIRPGPGTVSWKINREMIVVAGWGRAILLQLAHPAVAAGVHHHSSFRGSLLSSVRRLQSTVGAMLSITFGDTAEMVEAAARINTIHERVRGPVGGGGGTYSAEDPELQRWVHATLLDSIPRTYELLVGPLTPAERDAYCVEAAVMEPLLGMPAGRLPRNRRALDQYMEEMLAGDRLVVTDTSRALARAVLYPPRWYAGWPAFRPVQLLTLASLPPAVRAAYGFSWTDADARALTRWTRVLRTAVRVLPPAVRQWPIARRRVTPTARALDCSRDPLPLR